MVCRTNVTLKERNRHNLLIIHQQDIFPIPLRLLVALSSEYFVTCSNVAWLSHVLGLCMWSRREHQWVLGVASTSSEFSYVPKLTKSNQNTKKEFCARSTMPNIEVADITTGNTKPIVCQRCLQSFQEGKIGRAHV